MQITLVTSWGEEHGLINEIQNSVPDNGFKYMTESGKKKAEAKKKQDSRIVKARYINHRGKSERLEAPYCRYAGDKIQVYRLIPDQVYDLPMGFVEEINSKFLAVRSSEDNDKTKVDSKVGEEKIHELFPVSF